MATTVIHCILVFIILVSTTSIKAELQCPSGLNSRSEVTTVKPYRDKCYQFVHVEKYWPDARDYCWKYGGNLVTIPDSIVNDFLKSSLNGLPWSNNGVWIGLHDIVEEMNWYWLTGDRNIHRLLGWSNWGYGHPGASFARYRDCVRMDRDNGKWTWHETTCSALNWHYRFICEYDMVLAPTNGVNINEQHMGRPVDENDETSRLLSPSRPNMNIENGGMRKDADNGKFTTHMHESRDTTSTPYRPITTNTVTDIILHNKISLPTTLLPSTSIIRSPLPGVKVAVAAAKDGLVGGTGIAEEHKVSVVAVVVAFIAGIVCALLIFLFVFFRRRKRAGSNLPSGLSNPVYSQIRITDNICSDEAMGDQCCGDDCAAKCVGENENVRGTTAAVPESATANGTTSRRDRRMARHAVEPNIYTESENPAGMPAAQMGPGVGMYLPMSSSNGRNGYVPKDNSSKDGVELPPVPNDGYEVPQAASPNVYSEIPELSPDSDTQENVYATIDEVKRFSR